MSHFVVLDYVWLLYSGVMLVVWRLLVAALLMYELITLKH